MCLEHYIASKSFAAFRKTFSNACTYREVPNKKTVHRLEANFGTQMVVCGFEKAMDMCCKAVLFVLPNKKKTHLSCYWCHQSARARVFGGGGVTKATYKKSLFSQRRV